MQPIILVQQLFLSVAPDSGFSMLPLYRRACSPLLDAPHEPRRHDHRYSTCHASPYYTPTDCFYTIYSSWHGMLWPTHFFQLLHLLVCGSYSSLRGPRCHCYSHCTLHALYCTPCHGTPLTPAMCVACHHPIYHAHAGHTLAFPPSH